MASSSSSAIDGALRTEETRGTDRIEEGDDHDEVGVSYSSCGCFFGFGSRLSRSGSVRCGYLPLQPHRKDEEVKQSWMMKKVKRLNEIIKALLPCTERLAC